MSAAIGRVAADNKGCCAACAKGGLFASLGLSSAAAALGWPTTIKVRVQNAD
jgi:hypothetical protein